MNGLFSETLAKCANWFLYIFINADAPLNKSIMRKRANQIKWLKRLDSLNAVYNYNDLVLIVQNGIVAKYGKKPSEVLSIIYNTAVGTNVNGVSSSILDNATNKGVTDLNNLSLKTTTASGATTDMNFWEGLSEVLTYIKEILGIIGINTKTSDIQPTSNDWIKPGASDNKLAAVGDILPWGMAAAVVWFLSSSPNGKKKKEK